MNDTITKPHPHAHLMALYAQDAAETETPWERWECRKIGDEKWETFVMPQPSWRTDYQYRRKPVPVLTPEQIADGWIKWHGVACIVEPMSRPTVLYRNTLTFNEFVADSRRWSHDSRRWSHHQMDGDIIAYRPDPYGRFRQALADGKRVEVQASTGHWDKVVLCVAWTFIEPPDRYRIVETKTVPIGPEDVPPLSLIRRRGESQTRHWRLVSYVTGIGPTCADRGYNWDELASDYEINRSLASGKWDATAWEPCKKQSL